MINPRRIKKIIKSKPTLEGAGVHLKRVFGFNQEALFDPFLLLDDFRSDNPAHFVKGFPWHPHRGIETITYVLKGDVEHGDSMGNEGIISSGDVQWMTAGSGIIHQEMPKGDPEGRMYGFQLWANLPRKQKMMGPRYRDVKAATIPEVTLANGTKIRVISGRVGDTVGPVQDIVIDPEYLDITVPPRAVYEHPTKKGHTVFAYVIGGNGVFCQDKESFTYAIQGGKGFDMQSKPFVENESLVLFDDGDAVIVSTGDQEVRFLLISGKPIGEPVAWRGPIVMNTREELEIAFDEYQKGTFIKQEGS
ncbi:MAG: pirin family protein [Proteobacteria bacterium]|nr:pirin family protein [Pseudomonadota bacterium]MBU1709585.1 pirin family protein [Pseudomonadota bacterium]